MALRWICSVDAYDDLAERWDYVDNMVITANNPRRAGAKSITPSYDSGFISSPVVLTDGRAVLGVAFRPATDVARAFISLHENGTGAQVTLELGGTAGLVSLRRGTSAGTVLESKTGQYTGGTWHYLELDVTVANSGAWTVRIDGATVLSGSGDTQQQSTNGLDYFKMQSMEVATPVQFCDIYVDSDTLRGDCIVQTIFPTGAGAATQFIPYPNANWNNVSDLIDGDASYNSATGSNTFDLFAFGDLPSIPGSSILGVGVNAVLRKDDSATRTAYLLARPSSTVYNQNAGAVTSSYKNYQKIWETNPGGGAWTEAGVNGAQFGYMQYGVS